MLEDINKQINNIKDKVAKKHVLESKLNNLNKQFYKSESELKDLECKLQKELDDVENLKKLSLSSIMSTIMRNKDEKMEKEEKEYLMAKLEYDKCISKVNLLKLNINDINMRLQSLSDCENEYSNLLKRKVELINTYGDESNKNKLINLEREIDSYLREIKELDESIYSGNSLLSEIVETKKLLESAKTWGTLDLLGGDLISSLAKHKRVDEAQLHFTKVSNLLNSFNKELKDVNVNVSSLSFSSTSKTFDIFFDNIFTDISVNSQINKSYEDICDLQKKVSSILNNLEENKNKSNEMIIRKRNEYDEFIKIL